jgi:hypothetical protein
MRCVFAVTTGNAVNDERMKPYNTVGRRFVDLSRNTVLFCMFGGIDGFVYG